MKDVDKASTLTIRVKTEEERECIRTAIRETGCRQASKALLRCCAAFQRLAGQCRSQQKTIERLRAENAKLKAFVATVTAASRQAEDLLDK